MSQAASRLTRLLHEGKRPLVMGVLNVTPDSFSDGGKYLALDKALAQASRMAEEGADILDIGGESTRPGAAPVPVAEELARVLPVIKALRQQTHLPLSIDTRKAEVMRQAAEAGASLINDVSALEGEGALQAAAATGLPICLMHKQGEPASMQDRPEYKDVVAEIAAYFTQRIAACEAAGIPKARLLLDIGFGFGKTPAHNLCLLNRLHEFQRFGCPLLIGLSRKSTIAKLTPDLLSGSLAGAVAAALKGARVLRVHDVAPTVAALRVAAATQAEALPAPAAPIKEQAGAA